MGCHHYLRRLALLAAALCVVVATHERGCCAAARPLMRRHGAAAAEEEEEAVVMDVSAAAASPEGARWGGGDGFVREGKWLTLPALPTGGLRFPGAGVSMPWMVGAPPALAGPGVQLMPPFVGATRQEQLSLWASLFNPFQVRPRLPAAAETTSPGPVDIPAIAGVAPEKTTVDEPAGEPKWGVFVGNNNGNN
ncbi:hypothetical protein E2562_023674 [Oryza meyeriana var. granulata]|uniref:Uncharacterized protein n=1 Tax=Oryza meyeriana var. granulata TaxID=110450 RepID=A0A6G1BNN1_9ORYZ|nr:hypothetical protein E2562_023674 [Oryza meyeriana var. granulata]